MLKKIPINRLINKNFKANLAFKRKNKKLPTMANALFGLDKLKNVLQSVNKKKIDSKTQTDLKKLALKWAICPKDRQKQALEKTALFNMLRKEPFKKSFKKVFWGTFDLETVSVPINALPKKDLEFFFNLNDEVGFTDSYVFYSTAFNLDSDNCIQLPIAYCYTHPTANLNETGEKNAELNETDKKKAELNQTGEEKGNVFTKTNCLDPEFLSNELIVEASCNLMKEFFTDLFDSRNLYLPAKAKLYLYGHNAGNFDSYFLALFFLKLEIHKLSKKRLAFKKKKGSYLTLKIGQQIEIRDSRQLLSGSLEELGQKLVNKGKKQLPIKRFTFQDLVPGPSCKVTLQELKEYVTWDTLLLFNILSTFEDFLQKNYKTSFCERLTISSLTVLIFFRHYYSPFMDKDLRKWVNGIFVLTKEQDLVIRSGYRGGRTELFKPHLGEGKVYDINSAYVAAMMDNPLPTGKARGPYSVIDGLGFFYHDLDNFFGFAEAEVFSLPDTKEPKALPHLNHKGNLIFPCGHFKGWFFSEELKMAKKRGYLINIHQVIYCDSSIGLFKPYLENLSEIRKNFSKSHPYNDLAKRLGNALYGRFAMNTKPDCHFVVYSDKQLRKWVEKYDIKELVPIKTKNGKNVYSFEGIKEKEETKVDQYSAKFKMLKIMQKVAPQVSAAISSYVRIQIAELLYNDTNHHIAYVDTDSAFVEGMGFPFKPDPSTPGAWKEENCFKEALLLGPKFYKLILSNPDADIQDAKFKVRGLPESYKKEIMDEDLFNFLIKKDATISISGNVEDGRMMLQADKLDLVMQEKPRPTTLAANAVDSLCTKIFDQNGTWIKTERLVVINGLPSNKIEYSVLYAQKLASFHNYFESISYKNYREMAQKTKKLQRKQEALTSLLSNPFNLPGHGKFDSKSGFFKRKTRLEIAASFELNQANYIVLQQLRSAKKDNILLSHKEKSLLVQLEVILSEFLLEHKITEEEVQAFLHKKHEKITSKLYNAARQIVFSRYKNLGAFTKTLNILEENLQDEVILEENLQDDIIFEKKLQEKIIFEKET